MSATSGEQPFALGFVFRQGAIPAGKHATANIANVQVTPKSSWPDGSTRMAIVAGRANLQSNTALSVTLSATSSAQTGSALTTADLKASGLSVNVACGSFGTVNWSGTEWDSPHMSWVSGPQMSSWIFRKPVGSDAHLTAWLEIRFFAGGAVEVLPWIENGYIRVAGPTSKSATFVVTINASQRFSASVDLPSHCRTPLVNGATLSHWVGGNEVVVKHDMAYLMSTRMVPYYAAQVSAGSSNVSRLPTSYVPLQQGNYPNAMGTAGYDPSIGLLPEWDVLYLTSSSSAVWAGLQRNAYSAGRYPLHYRDEGTLRPLRFSQYPNTSINQSSTNDKPPTPGGTSAPNWAVSHHPSVGYVAYMITGRMYHLETLQFAATMNYLKNVDSSPYGNRRLSEGVFMTHAGANTVRGAAWSIRTLAQAAVSTPDGDALKTEFNNSLSSNIAYYHGKHVAQSSNPFGFVQPYSDASGTGDNVWYERSWMQDFFVQSIGFVRAAKPALSATALSNLAAFHAHNAKSVIGRLQGAGATEYLYRDAAVYNISMGESDNPDWDNGTGPWASSWGQVYSRTMGFEGRSDPKEIGDGSLRGPSASAPNTATGYWGNMLPALSYAVEHGVPGAAEAYARLTGAPNWSGISNDFNGNPVWSILPP